MMTELALAEIPAGLPRYGGKSARSTTGTGRWVNSLLPTEGVKAYVEPCVGSGGILCQRRPARREIVNDLSGDLVNWWLAVRDAKDEFGHLVAYTPMAEPLFREYKRVLMSGRPTLAEMPDIERALAFHVYISASWAHSEGEMGHNHMVIGKVMATWKRERIEQLAERMRAVQIFHEDMCEFLERRTFDKDDYLIYMDPPYYTANTTAYEHSLVDGERLTATLKNQAGRVAISGYPGEWDHLGWHRHEYETFTLQASGAHNQVAGAERMRKPRVEVLWTNYEAPRQAENPPQLDLFGGAHVR